MTIARHKMRPDHYTAEDYYNLPEDVHTELIDGVFYDMAQPSRIHQRLVLRLSVSIQNHIDAGGGSCEVYPAPFGVQPKEEDDKTIVEPDVSVICDREKLTDRGCVGAPDWIIEIVSPSNPAHDYVRKLGIYLDAGVREYWIVNPMTQEIATYILENESFRLNVYTFNDRVSSYVMEGLEIDFSAIDLN